MKFKKTLLTSVAIITALTLASCGQKNNATKKVNHHVTTMKVSSAQHKIMRAPINYKKPSELKNYPKNMNAKTDKIIVSLRKQRVYIQRRGKTIYTMYCSTGSHNRTPKGHYKINNVRTNWFYSKQEHEGAQYGTGWHDGGVYLFHATPANQKKQIMQNVAKQLGKHPSSHGCVHLTIPDAHWFETHVQTGTPVIIQK